MSDTPRTDDAYFNRPDPSRYDLAGEMKIMERELNAANAIIRQQQLLEEENLRLQERIKRLESVTSDPHALWANWLRGSVALPVGIGDVREHQERIKQLEESLESANTFLQLVMCEQNHLREVRNKANDRIKRMEEELMDANNKYAVLVADVVLYEDRGERIRLLISERDSARLQADKRVSLREEFRELLGTDDIEQGVVVVRGLKERIRRLEDTISRAAFTFFRDGSDRKTAIRMLAILEEVRKP